MSKAHLVAVVHTARRALALLLTSLVWLAGLGPFAFNEGPIDTYSELSGKFLGGKPIFGEASLWLRIGVLSLGWAYLVHQTLAGSPENRRKRLILSACMILVFLQISSSSFQDLADLAVVWVPVLTLMMTGEREAKFMFRLLCCLLALQVLVGLGAYAINYRQFASPIVGKRASGLLTSPSAVYPIYLVAIFVFRALANRTDRGLRRIGWQSLAGIAVVLEILTFSRAGWLGLGAGLVLPARGQTAKSRSVYLALGAALILAAFYFRAGPLSLPKDVDRSMSGHLSSVRAGLEALPPLAIFGGGPHAFENSSVYLSLLERNGSPPPGPLCLPLYLALDWGIPGMLLFVFIGCQSFRLELERPGASLGYGRSIVAITVASLFYLPVFGDRLSLPATLLVTGMLGLLVSLPPLGAEVDGLSRPVRLAGPDALLQSVASVNREDFQT